MAFVEVHYHPILFTAMALLSLAELVLTAYLINDGNEHHTFYNERDRALLISFCAVASWTTLFSATYMLWFFDRAGHLLASIASSVAWLLTTGSLWAVASGLMHVTRPGGSCVGELAISKCRQSLAVESLGWGVFGVCFMAMFATCFWMYWSRRISKRVDSDTDSTTTSLA